MGIAFFTFGGMFSPLHSLMGWLGHRPRNTDALPHARQAPAHGQAARTRASRPLVTRPCDKARKPLRVVRVLDTSGATAGRMFMSGRMADVCAELDRLAALEAAAG